MIEPIYYEIGQKLIEKQDPLLKDFIENKIRIIRKHIKKIRR